MGTLLNMLIGILCDVITTSAKEEKDQNRLASLVTTITEAFEDIDVSEDGHICEDEWKLMRTDTRLRKKLLESFGIKPVELDDTLDKMQDVLFHDFSQAQQYGINAEGADEQPARTSGKGLGLAGFSKALIDLR